MCGIGGWVNLLGEAVDTSTLRTMMSLQKHRGPDDEGIERQGNIGLGHVRLSILDLSPAGHQPMFDNSGDYVITFNGEIYNYLELREELSSFYNFRTQTDTEVILASYLKWGKDCLNRFNGDWAFVIWHKPSGELFGARDRFGIKPFYYALNERRFIFASEIKALLPFVDRSENRQSLYNFVMFNRTDYSTDTMFANIKKLGHGEYFILKNGRIQFERWYNVKDHLDHNEYTFEEAKERFNELFARSIDLRLRSDVPVGLSLSGGLDSSSLLSVILKNHPSIKMNTFSAVYPGYPQADESEYIRSFEGTNSSLHFSHPSADTFLNDMVTWMNVHSEPIAALGPYAQFKVMELAKNHVTVTLDGQGADESLTGYLYFYASYFKELLEQGRFKKLNSEIHRYRTIHADSTAFKYWLIYSLPPNLKSKVVLSKRIDVRNSFFEENRMNSELALDLLSPSSLRASLIEHFEYKLEHLLKWDDHNAMHFSLESRVPFLDHILVEFLLSLPSHFKINNGVTKFVMRESLKEVLPKKIYERRDKKGYATPMDDWFRRPQFVPLVKDIILSSELKDSGIFNPEACTRMLDQHLAGQANYSKEIWKWINLHHWFSEKKGL